MSIMHRQLLRHKVGQKISIIKTNICNDVTKIVHFGILIYVLSLSTKAKVFALITEIFGPTF